MRNLKHGTVLEVGHDVSTCHNECLPRLHFEKAKCQGISIPITILRNMIEANDVQYYVNNTNNIL